MGTHIVITGVMRVFSASTYNPQPQRGKTARLCAGIGVTALVQSSNATTLLVTSFVARDLVADASSGDCAGR